jgi:hypothetical protein
VAKVFKIRNHLVTKNRKTGVDFYTVASIVQVFMLLTIFIFYTQMEEPVLGKGALSQLTEQFSGRMTVLLFFQVAFMVFERYLFLMNPRKWNDWETFSSQVTNTGAREIQIASVRRITRGLENATNPEKMKVVFRRVRANMKFFQLDHQEFNALMKESDLQKQAEKTPDYEKVEDYKYNPLVKRLSYLKFLIFFFYTIMFIYFPLFGNYKATNSKSYFCNTYYVQNTGSKCNTVSENTYIQVFYWLTTIYFILCALQIKKGESFLKNQKKTNSQWTTSEKLSNTIVTKVPLVFEIKTSLDFAVTKTSLSLAQWFKFEDIYNTFFAAKYDQIASDMKPLGEVQTRTAKYLTGWGIVIILIAVLLAPIFIFSSFNPDSLPNTIVALESTLGLKIENSKFAMYSNNNPKEIKNMTVDDYIQKINKGTNLINYQQGQIQEVTLYPFGDTNWDISKDMYSTLSDILVKTLNQGQPAQMYLDIRLTQLNGKVLLWETLPDVSPQTLMMLQESLTKCGNLKITVSDMYYQLLKINSAKGIEIVPANPQTPDFFNQTVELRPVCVQLTPEQKKKLDQTQIAYWNVTSESLNSQGNTQSGISMYFVVDTYSKNLSMFSSVVAMYTGFVLIAWKFINGMCTGQTMKIWATDVPKAEQIIRICEGVVAARISGDNTREEILYLELIDLVRSPEMIKLVTTSYLDHKKNLEKIHANKKSK